MKDYKNIDAQMIQNQYALKLVLGIQWGQKALKVKVTGKSPRTKGCSREHNVNS